jgi:ATP phosphoribosyltransferase regulatory subunit
MSDAAAAIWQVLERFNPRRVAPPVLQPAELYLDLMGEDIRARAILADDGLCLRPDMTIPALRLALAEGVTHGALAYEGLVFRRQPAGSIKESEFTQVGMELLGPNPATVEGDLILATLAACRALGVTARLTLGHASFWTVLTQAMQLEPVWAQALERAFAQGGVAAMRAAAETAFRADPIAHAVAALQPQDAEAAVTAMLSAQGSAPRVGRTPAQIAARLQAKAALVTAPRPTAQQLAVLAQAMAIAGPPAQALAALDALRAAPELRATAQFETVLTALSAVATRIATGFAQQEAILRPAFGRGLAFYDGVVFELEAPALGARASLGGGGRYDKLVAALGGPRDCVAAGFALRPQRLQEAAR